MFVPLCVACVCVCVCVGACVVHRFASATPFSPAKLLQWCRVRPYDERVIVRTLQVFRTLMLRDRGVAVRTSQVRWIPVLVDIVLAHATATASIPVLRVLLRAVNAMIASSPALRRRLVRVQAAGSSGGGAGQAGPADGAHAVRSVSPDATGMDVLHAESPQPLQNAAAASAAAASTAAASASTRSSGSTLGRLFRACVGHPELGEEVLQLVWEFDHTDQLREAAARRSRVQAAAAEAEAKAEAEAEAEAEATDADRYNARRRVAMKKKGKARRKGGGKSKEMMAPRRKLVSSSSGNGGGSRAALRVSGGYRSGSGAGRKKRANQPGVGEDEGGRLAVDRAASALPTTPSFMLDTDVQLPFLLRMFRREVGGGIATRGTPLEGGGKSVANLRHVLEVLVRVGLQRQGRHGGSTSRWEMAHIVGSMGDVAVALGTGTVSMVLQAVRSGGRSEWRHAGALVRCGVPVHGTCARACGCGCGCGCAYGCAHSTRGEHVAV